MEFYKLLQSKESVFDATIAKMTSQKLIEVISGLQQEMADEQKHFNNLSNDLAAVDSNSSRHAEISTELMASQGRLAMLMGRNMKCFTQQTSIQNQELLSSLSTPKEEPSPHPHISHTTPKSFHFDEDIPDSIKKQRDSGMANVSEMKTIPKLEPAKEPKSDLPEREIVPKSILKSSAVPKKGILKTSGAINNSDVSKTDTNHDVQAINNDDTSQGIGDKTNKTLVPSDVDTAPPHVKNTSVTSQHKDNETAKPEPAPVVYHSLRDRYKNRASNVPQYEPPADILPTSHAPAIQ
ncbi:unnamed protein product, partial [Owenia fusiformis]